MRKFTKEQYENFDYFEDDDENTKYGQKLVKTRTEHTCSSILDVPHFIKIGTEAICESAINIEKGRVSNYICLDCINKYIEENNLAQYM